MVTAVSDDGGGKIFSRPGHVLSVAHSKQSGGKRAIDLLKLFDRAQQIYPFCVYLMRKWLTPFEWWLVK